MPGRALALIAFALAACSPPVPTRTFSEPLAQGSCPGELHVVNASSRTVDRLFVARLSLEGWGSDRLGQEVLRPGRSVRYRGTAPGAQDLRVIWADGRAAELRHVDPCTAGTVRVEDHGLTAGLVSRQSGH